MCNFPSAQNIEKKMKESMEKKTPLANFLPFHALASYASDKSY